MSLDKINHLNSGLMILSALVAWVLPFELFLFSYAILGPLHYLSEISWLHDRNYYSPGKGDGRILWGLSVILSVWTLSWFGLVSWENSQKVYFLFDEIELKFLALAFS